MFGVNPKPTNYTSIEGYRQDSYMTSLKKQSLIPSTSFGYTAGAPYRLKGVLGGLTLGGYDVSKFVPNPHSFTFAPDNSRDLVVGIQSIAFEAQNGTTSNLLPFGILAYIDSTIPYIYLPLEACKAFEKAFNLKYNATTQLYPVSDSQHADLIAQNASITFTLGDDVKGGDTVNITLPYDSFDLTATFPLVDDSTRYFPLKRAANESQYTLGRTFLQEAYLIVDYERSNFSVSQCLFQDGSQQKLIGIPPALSSNVTTTPAGSKSSSSTNHNTIVIGIAVGVSALAVAIAASVATFFLIKKRRARKEEEKAKADFAKAEEEAARKVRLGFDKAELGTVDHARYEMGGSDTFGHPLPPLAKEKADFFYDRGDKHELLAGDVEYSELPDQKGPVYEMYDASSSPVELPADVPRELPAAFPSRRSSAMRLSIRSAHPRSSATSPFNDPSGHLSPSSSESRRSSGQPSPIDRRMRRTNTPPTRSSTLNSDLSAPSPVSQSGPSSPTDRSMNASPRSDELLSPISPILGSEEGLSPTERTPSPTSPQNPPIPAPSPGGSSRGRRSPHIAALRSEDSRRRERRRRNEP